MALNPKILGRPLFPSFDRSKDIAKSALSAFVPPAGTPPATVAGVTPIPSGASLSQLQYRGPLISTNYGLPPSERPDFRNPAMQWDARPVTPAGPAAMGSGRTISTNDAIAANLANMSDYDRGFYEAAMRPIDFRTMSPSSQSVVESSRTPLSGINAPINTSIQGMNVDRSAIATRMPQMPSGITGSSPFNLAGATQQTTPLLANQVPEMPVNVAQGRTPIKTPYGTIYATASQVGAANEIAARGPQAARMDALGEQLTQAAKLTRIRQQGPQIAQNRIAQQDEYFKQKRAESSALAKSTQEALKSGVSSEKIAQARSSYYQSQPNTLAGIRNEFQSMVPEFGTPMEQRTRVAGVRSSFGLPAGGPQPMQGSYTPSFMANNNEDRFQSIFRNIRSPFRNV
jgi:hypothetical protein